MAKISVLYVVRNEQDLIEKSIKSVQPIADEIIVVDTGSLDKTISICRKFNYVRIFSHAWVHDYSKTKNYGIRQCKGDWIVCMDADEMLDPASASAIHNAVHNAKSNIVGFGLHIVDHEASFDCNSPSNPEPFFPSPQLRIFRKHEKISFEGRVMEGVVTSAKKVGGIDLLDAKIHHFLWHGKGQDFKEGRLRYYEKLGMSASAAASHPRVLATEVQPQTAIVLPAFNALASTKECLGSICRHTGPNHSVCFVDNGSVDGTYEFMRGVSGKNPVRFPVNLGVARAKNAGAKEALGDANVKYICFLDNDTRVSNGWLDKMIRIMSHNPKIGMIGPLSNNADGPQCINNQPADAGKPLDQREPDFFMVDSLGGFCMVVSADALRKVGLFDESFGIYGFEDKDLCRRMKDSGYEMAVANRAFVEHRGKATVMENKLDWQKLLSDSGVKFGRKYAIPSAQPEALARAVATPIHHQSSWPHSFVILTHNRLDMTKQCIESIMSTSSNYELIIVDNASTDETCDWVSKRCPNAVIIRNKENVGIPKARNQGIKAAKTDYIVIMDNDVVLSQGWYEEMFRPIMDGADIVGIEGWQIDHSFAASWKCQAANERFDYLGGACTVFKRKVFEKIGLLDEGFSPAYYEDVDICIRAKAVGMKLVWMPSKRIDHREHATLVHCQRTFKYQEALANSHVRFAKKMRREIHVVHEMLPPVPKKLKILYLGMHWDYGVRERGTSFEQDNFYPALRQWEHAAEFTHFDYVDMGKLYGIGKMSDMLYEKVQQVAPDVIFSVWYDENHDPRRDMINKIRRTTPTKVVSWFCDSHYRYDNFDKPWAEYLDWCVTTSTAGLEKYKRDGLGHKVIKSQWGAAPSYKYMPDVIKDMDVLFVGQPHGDRKQVIKSLQTAGIGVQTFGFGWERRLGFQEMVGAFNRAKINLNLANGADVRVKQIKGRNFEVPACGGFLLTGVAENLSDYYEFGKEIVTFDGTADLADKIKHYLAHPEEREAIAKAGYERTMREHTYSHRFNQIFKAAGLI